MPAVLAGHVEALCAFRSHASVSATRARSAQRQCCIECGACRESASTQCYKPGEAKAELSCGADVVPKVVTAATDCTALASAPVRAPAGAPAPAPAAPVKAKAAPVAAPPALAPAPVAAQVAAAAPAPVPGAVALAECTPAECRDGLTDYLVANASVRSHAALSSAHPR